MRKLSNKVQLQSRLLYPAFACTRTLGSAPPFAQVGSSLARNELSDLKLGLCGRL